MSVISPFRRRLLNSVKPKLPNYLCFTALEDGTFTLTIPASLSVSDMSYIEYTIDEGDSWIRRENADSTQIVITTPTVKANENVYWRGFGMKLATSYGNVYSNFSSTCKFIASGNFHSIYRVDDFNENSTFKDQYCAVKIFMNSLIVECHIDFGIITMNNTCRSAFENCQELLICTSNFRGSGGVSCFLSIFKNCPKLLVSPNLLLLQKATGSSSEFNEGFKNCVSLTSIELPFYTKLGQRHYLQCFYGCTNLNYIKMLSTDISATRCLNDWVYNVAATGIFVKNINATWNVSGASGIPANWTIIYYDPSNNKYYIDQSRSAECDDHGNLIT